MIDSRNLLYARFGRLDAIERRGTEQWLCRCSCGREVLASTDALLARKVRSCGCFWHVPILVGTFLTTFTAIFFALSWLLFGVAVALHPSELSLSDFWEYDYSLPITVAFVLGGLVTERTQKRWNRR